MRLIDADKSKKSIDELFELPEIKTKLNPGLLTVVKELMRTVFDMMPTAFDPERIIEQLEESKKKAMKGKCINVANPKLNCDVLAFSIAIELIRNGMKDEEQ